MNYFETLATAVEAAVQRGADRCELETPDDVWALGRDHLPYETVRTGDFKLTTLKGIPTRKFFHVSIYRVSSGRYELTTYIL